MTSSLPRVIGRYALYGEIAAGGMATVHYGRLLGVVGFSRTVAIKRLHPQFAKDPEFVSMFLDEARLAARIRHPNVVSTLDVVTMEGEIFLVMEYVQGVPLSRLGRAASQEGGRIPPEVAASIVAGALHGLHAAHEATSERGEPLHLVHRDVSPQNILVGVDGVARVLDFGVAKAIGRLQTTRDGQVKGKLAYMAPEHVTGKEVSRASDIFAASVVLWEALTGERLYGGSDDGQVIYRILNESADPPSKYVPDLPPALDEVVLRGLARSPLDRYATARDMARAIEASLPLPQPSEVGDYVESVAGTLLESRTRALAVIEADASSPASKDEPATHVDVGQPPFARSDEPPPTVGKGRSRGLQVGAALGILALALAGAGVSAARRGAGPTPSSNPTEGTSASPGVLDVPAPSAVADASGFASASSSAKSSDPSPPLAPAFTLRPPAPRPAPRAACDPPFTMDSQGYKHYKRECMH